MKTLAVDDSGSYDALLCLFLALNLVRDFVHSLPMKHKKIIYENNTPNSEGFNLLISLKKLCLLLWWIRRGLVLDMFTKASRIGCS